MALPPCFRLVDSVFPRVRALAAHELARDGWSQGRIAEALGISQSMVSRHLHARRPAGDALASRLARELVAELRGEAEPTIPSPWCTILSEGTARPGADDALDDLVTAEALLCEANPLAVAPQIGMNLARALPEAKRPGEVLAFPGRIVEAGGRLVSPAAPERGASGHLARCLLALRAAGNDALALASVRGGKDVVQAALALRWRIAEIDRSREGETEALFKAALSPDIVAVHDPGAVGIEPCLYVAGRDARDAVSHVVALNGKLVVP